MQATAVVRARLSTWLDSLASIAMIAAGLGMLWVAFSPAEPPPPPGTKPEPPAAPISIVGAARLGSPAADVLIVVFSDFECPYCGKFAQEVLPLLRTEYIDRSIVELVFRHLPISAIHLNANRAASAADCAMEQGHFWAFHDELFRNHRSLGEGDIVEHARRVGLELEPFRRCLAVGVTPRVKADLEMARSLGVNSTPLFLIGKREGAEMVRVTQVIAGARPIADFRAALDSLLR